MVSAHPWTLYDTEKNYFQKAQFNNFHLKTSRMSEDEEEKSQMSRGQRRGSKSVFGSNLHDTRDSKTPTDRSRPPSMFFEGSSAIQNQI
mmetsp:Transcript_4336/g.4107  ORF Transcript_4336/g.4107 Transcript_4336/m.4107 type:complete len:89 (+) Transcript_4336:179-445(+)